ncbi:MAG: hypothetical protein B7Y03_00310 [Polaromonas sp. 24-62-144]|uniref:hypothetical protein n=1 Tax=Polaromonas sp. TaxID=1869339 RepID=UPI000BCDBA43|nr:hypothetical protein [Polaromonas sp.]OYZ85274.1 MAG: hypothetical protein B7Y03_00310 [Polaromonas sp. 24-62-144]HQS31393.1 hypothetical protein [Polaromonas sp.]HQS90706.1 hypothetical protein [Polaromonas sp.]
MNGTYSSAWLRTVVALLLACCGSGPTHAVPEVQRLSGLFHNQGEESLLIEAMTPRPAPPKPQAVVADLYLSAILYVGPQNWVIWVNGRPLRAGDQHGALRVLKVSAAQVQLTVENGEGEARTPVITLRPMQAYLASTYRVVDRITDLSPRSMPSP